MDDNTTPHVHDDNELLHHDPEEDGSVRSDVNDEESLYDDASDENGFDLDDAVAAASEPGGSPVDQLRHLVVWLVDQLVDEPGNVSVDAVERGSAVQIQVRLPEADLGKVIGRGGRIAKSMRTALMIVGSRHHLRVSLDIEGQA